MIKYVINGRFLTQKITGVQRYALEVISRWDCENNEFIIAVPPKSNVENPFKYISVIEIGHLSGQLWTQISLAKYARQKKLSIITFCGLSSIFKPDYWAVYDLTFKRYPKSFNWKFRLAYGLVYRINLKRTKLIIVDSNFAKEEIRDYYKIEESKFVVGYCGITTFKNDVETVEYDDTKKMYLTVGSRNFHKNQAFIYKLAKLNKDSIFIVVGGGDFKSFNASGDCNLANVVYTGYISDSKLRYLYTKTDGFIFPSLYEGFGIPPLEAIINNCKRVYLSNIQVFREIYSQGVNFFEPCGEAFLLEENDITISKEDYDFYVGKYDWEKTAKLILNCLGKEKTK